MSKTELARFCSEYLPSHPELKDQIDARGDKQKLAKGLARAALEAGFNVSEHEILEALTPAPSAPLSDTELDAVAGGRKAGGSKEEYYKVTLEDVFISSYQSGGTEGS
jgi:hypothetical protein